MLAEEASMILDRLLFEGMLAVFALILAFAATCVQITVLLMHTKKVEEDPFE